jgi:hypothetical protein
MTAAAGSADGDPADITCEAGFSIRIQNNRNVTAT